MYECTIDNLKKADAMNDHISTTGGLIPQAMMGEV